ncbi:MAG: hypothetical protein HYU66_06480 [Armatimonadetes bacterium]|nr:hypothetical protein [Armatimonadota bacterium]
MAKKKRSRRAPAQRVSRGRPPDALTRAGGEAIRRRLEDAFGEVELVLIPSTVSMSSLLVSFVQPYRTDDTDADSYRSLLGVGMVAWNAALLSRLQRFLAQAEFVQLFPLEARADARRMFRELVRRKLAHFADCRRAILGFELTVTPREWHVTVTSDLGDGP